MGWVFQLFSLEPVGLSLDGAGRCVQVVRFSLRRELNQKQNNSSKIITQHQPGPSVVGHTVIIVVKKNDFVARKVERICSRRSRLIRPLSSNHKYGSRLWLSLTAGTHGDPLLCADGHDQKKKIGISLFAAILSITRRMTFTFRWIATLNCE